MLHLGPLTRCGTRTAPSFEDWGGIGRSFPVPPHILPGMGQTNPAG